MKKSLADEIRDRCSGMKRPLTNEQINMVAEEMAVAEDMGFISRKSPRVPAKQFYRHYVLNLILRERL